MTILDYIVFGIYMLAVLAVGAYFFRRNKDAEDYFVGGRSVSATHVGLSVVATDVGGGFSIGLGGVGFVMGLSGSWLLFTGLVGAWLSAVFIIPRVKRIDAKHGMLTYPDLLRHTYGNRVAMLAAVISGIGYLGFTSGQILAGAKLAAGTLFHQPILGLGPHEFSLLIIGTIIILYTMLGGLKAVIYTDTVQWIVLLVGLIFFAIPFALIRVGGLEGLREALPDRYFDITAIDSITIINWFVTIIPIWIVAMTLYQRIFACRNEKEAKKAWFMAGLFEYPIMAFMGVFLGMCARVLFPTAEPEMGLPLLIKTVLPIGFTGIVVAAYFSAIMSTADSCLIASSGNLVNDILQRTLMKKSGHKRIMRISQVATGLLGVLAVGLAALSEEVLGVILHAYSFLVSGLFIPTLGAYFWPAAGPRAAFWSMMSGGTLTLALIFSGMPLPLGLDPTLFGIAVSTAVFVVLGQPGFRSRQVERPDL